jgi:hypothetical protein
LETRVTRATLAYPVSVLPALRVFPESRERRVCPDCPENRETPEGQVCNPYFQVRLGFLAPWNFNLGKVCPCESDKLKLNNPS